VNTRFLKELDDQLEVYQRTAWSLGLSRPVGRISATAARDFADKLKRCEVVATAKSEMSADQAGAQAFWLYCEAAIDETKLGSIRTLSDDPPPSKFVELLASTVFLFCERLLKGGKGDVYFEAA
jgi:hypothetical protein